MKTIEYRDDAVWILDQTRLPLDAIVLECRQHTEVAEAIVRLSIRGAPAIGVAAAYGVALAAHNLAASRISHNAFHTQLDGAIAELRGTRPTAVNLFWALQRVREVIDANQEATPHEIASLIESEAKAILREDEKSSRAMARFGVDLIPDGSNILTHCNSGALAASGFGTALGVIREAHDQDKHIHVWVDETRPLLQGARLTAWELQQARVPFTLITDSMAGHFMARGRVDLVMVGADRIVANGDAANKIGTYSLAVLAHAHDLPFYFVAPTSTIDTDTPTGDRITVEERKPDEITTIRGMRVAPENIQVANPAFDVTPNHLITAIITDRGVVRAPFAAGLARAMSDEP